jgi:hypothetical protein
MKTLIQENGGCPLYVEFCPAVRDNLVEMRLLEQAQDSDELLVKLRLVLTPEQRQRLKAAL